MSEIKVDTLTGKTTANDITVTVGASATMSLEQGLAKAWATWNGSGTVALTDSFGFSSILDNTTGDYTLTLSNAMSNDDYSITSATQENRTMGVYYGIGTAVTTTTVRFGVTLTNGSYTASDPTYAHMMAMGDLA